MADYDTNTNTNITENTQKALPSAILPSYDQRKAAIQAKQVKLTQDITDKQLLVKILEESNKKLREELERSNLSENAEKLRALNASNAEISQHKIQLQNMLKNMDQRSIEDILTEEDEKERAKKLRDFMGQSKALSPLSQGRSYMDNISGLNDHNWEGLAFSMLFEQLFLVIKIFATLTFGASCKGTVYGQNMAEYERLLKEEPGLCYDPADPQGKKIFKVKYMPNGTFEYVLNKEGNKIELEPFEVRTVDALANKYFPKPTMQNCLKQEMSKYINKILGCDADPEMDAALATFRQADVRQASQSNNTHRDTLLSMGNGTLGGPRP